MRLNHFLWLKFLSSDRLCSYFAKKNSNDENILCRSREALLPISIFWVFLFQVFLFWVFLFQVFLINSYSFRCGLMILKEATSRNLFFLALQKSNCQPELVFSLSASFWSEQPPTYCKAEEKPCQQHLNFPHFLHRSLIPCTPLLLVCSCPNWSPAELRSCRDSCQCGLCAPTGATGGR